MERAIFRFDERLFAMFQEVDFAHHRNGWIRLSRQTLRGNNYILQNVKKIQIEISCGNNNNNNNNIFWNLKKMNI